MTPPVSALRASLERELFGYAWQPALDQSLKSLVEGEQILCRGVAEVGNCESYYLFTVRRIYYADAVKAGFMKKRYEGRFFDMGGVTSIIVDPHPQLESAYLRFYRGHQELNFVMWFKDYLSNMRGMSSEQDARKLTDRFGK